jgi:hypothetical protein
MQRTVKSTVLTIAKIERVNGELTTHTDEIKVFNITDEKVAIRKAKKAHGDFVVLESRIEEDLYVLDDEIFFQYATVKRPDEH